MQFVILSPYQADLPVVFRNIEIDQQRYDRLLDGMQRLRGKAYLADGAIQADELNSDGRHALPVDEFSWHVLALDSTGQVTSCIRYLDESDTRGFENLWIRQAALSECPEQGSRFRAAVENEMARARKMSMGFGEVGGWAVADSHRRTLEPVGILLATYGLLELLGSCIGVATATFRHASSTILRKIGLASLDADGVELTPYFDSSYGCQMEVLRFDSRSPSSRYAGWVTELAGRLKEAPVICRSGLAATIGWKSMFKLPESDLAFANALAQAAAA